VRIPLVLALFALSCGAVDRRPLVRSPAYVQAIDAVNEAIAGAPRGSGALSAGWSRVELAVPPGAPLAGYGEREGAPNVGVLDPVYVRAFALESGGARVVLFTADLLLTSPAVAEAVAKQLAGTIGRDALFFTASHTHSSLGGYIPGVLWELVFGSYDPAAFDAVVAAHAEAAQLALDRLAPARIAAAETSAEGLIMNRVEKHGATDDRVLAILFERIADRKTALFWSFGCHAVTLPASNLRISADYPGVIARRLEAAKHEVVGYAAGGVGSSNPRFEPPAARSAPAERSGAGTPEPARASLRPDSEWLTAPLTAALERVTARAKAELRAEVTLAHAQPVVRLPSPRYRVGRESMLPPPLVEAVLSTPSAPFGAIAIDDLVLLHMPAEISGELTRTARAHARSQGVTLGIFPFNSSYAGYVVPRRVYDLEDRYGEEMLAYETQTLAFFGKWSGDFMMNVGLRLAAGVRAKATRAQPR
jgi:hypothetical protein